MTKERAKTPTPQSVPRPRRNKTSGDFWKHFERLPAKVQLVAREMYKQFKKDPYAPILHNKQIADSRQSRHLDGTRSVWVNYRYRALYVERGDVNLWYWIGSHEDYNDFTGST